MRNTWDTFPDVSPFVGITYYRVRAYLAPHIAMLYFDCSVIYCVPLRYFFLVDPETAGDPQFDYGVDDTSSLPEQPGKPPLITRYRLFLLSTACIRVV